MCFSSEAGDVFLFREHKEPGALQFWGSQALPHAA